MLRLPGTVLALLAAGALVAHAALLPALPWPAWRESLGGLAPAVGVLLFGRILLSWMPPGGVGEHSPRSLPVTGAVSALIGVLTYQVIRSNQNISCIPRLDPAIEYGVLALALVAGIVRMCSRPAAMVARHGVAGGTGSALAMAALVVGWTWAALLTLALGQDALLWFALFVAIFHALGVARRNVIGRLTVLALGATCVIPNDFGLPPALGLGLGASFLVPWLRRADRRAGAIAGLSFGSLFLSGFDPLAVVAAVVFVLASHPRQRRFAAIWVLGTGLVCAARAWAAPLLYTCWGGISNHAEHYEGLRRPLWAWVLRQEALDFELWGLAWPIVLAALALGLLAFPWRRQPWVHGSIEEPRREVLALSALLVLAASSMALPFSPWFEMDALRILFPPAALLAGLLLIPPERAHG